MDLVLVTFAMKEESRPFQRVIGPRQDLRVLLTGIGRRNAEETIRKSLAEQSPHLVLTCGFAGGLNPAFPGGTVAFSVDHEFSTSADSDPATRKERPGTAGARAQFSSREIWGVSAQNVSILPALLSAAGAKPARFHCTDRVIATAEEKRELWRSTGADAVEMESDVIRAICFERRIPSATVRVISDPANEDLPLDFNRLMDAQRRLSYGRLAVALLTSPGKIGALLKLQKQTRKAAEILAQVLAKALANFPH